MQRNKLQEGSSAWMKILSAKRVCWTEYSPMGQDYTVVCKPLDPKAEPVSIWDTETVGSITGTSAPFKIEHSPFWSIDKCHKLGRVWLRDVTENEVTQLISWWSYRGDGVFNERFWASFRFGCWGNHLWLWSMNGIQLTWVLTACMYFTKLVI